MIRSLRTINNIIIKNYSFDHYSCSNLVTQTFLYPSNKLHSFNKLFSGVIIQFESTTNYRGFSVQSCPFFANNCLACNAAMLGKNSCTQDFQKRYKSRKTQKRPEYDSGSDEEDEEEEGMSKATKPVTLRVQSLRLDGLLKKALSIARNKAETAFYEGNLRINGTRPTKKSYQVKVGDEVDIIKGVSPMNPEFLAVSRLEILSVSEDAEDDGELIVKVRRTKTMYVENYENDPWKKSSAE